MLIYNISLIRLSEGLYVNLLMICLFWIGSLGKYFHLFHFSGIRMEWNIRHRKFRRSSLLLNQANWSTVKIKSKLFNDAQRNFKIAFLDVVQHHNHKNQRPWTGTGRHRGEHGGQHHEGGRHHHEGSRRNFFWAKVFQVKTFASKTIFRLVHLLSFASLFLQNMVGVDSAPIYNFLLFCFYQNFFLTSSPFLCIAQ